MPNDKHSVAMRAAQIGPAAAPREERPPVPGLYVAVGAAAWILATVQFFAAQFIAATAWNPAYSWMNNYISDLGNTACGPFTVPHGTAMYVCSPRHDIMNASFIIAGLLTIAGAVLLYRTWPRGRMTRTALVLWLIAGVGKVVVGLVPENSVVGLHLLGALNVPVTSVAILLTGLAIMRTQRTLALAGILLAAAGLVGTVLSTAGEFAGSALYAGLGVGGMERVADYPATLWILLVGVVTLVALAAADRRGAKPDRVTA